jgi:hypothetical protein
LIPLAEDEDSSFEGGQREICSALNSSEGSQKTKWCSLNTLRGKQQHLRILFPAKLDFKDRQRLKELTTTNGPPLKIPKYRYPMEFTGAWLQDLLRYPNPQILKCLI